MLTALMPSKRVVILADLNDTASKFFCTQCMCLFFYLEKLVNVVTNEGTPLVCLPLDIKVVKALFQAAVVGSSFMVKFLFEDSLNIC